MVENSATPKSRSRVRPIGARILLLVFGILIALLIAEVGLRLAGFTYFNPYIVDQHLGYSLRPGAAGWWTREARVYVTINSQGLRDREHSISKPPNTFRIAVLGDSYAEAFQVPLEHAFWSIAERKLQQCPQYNGSNLEVLNFGISGFSTARELIQLRKKVWEYSPDLVLLLVTTGNDIRDNSKTLNEYSHQPLPYFELENGKLVESNSIIDARNQTLSFRLQKSALGRWFNVVQHHVRLLGLIYALREAKSAAAETAKRRQQSQQLAEPGLDSEVYRAPTTTEWSDAWQITERLIVQMRDEVRAKGAGFVVVTGSMGVQDTPDATARQAYMKRLGVENLFYPDLRIKSLGEREGFTVLNLAPAFAEHTARNKTFLHGSGNTIGFGHWNEAGHALAAELIAQQLCSEKSNSN